MADAAAVEVRIRTSRSARFYRWGEPSGATRELWIACHGYGHLAAAFARELEPFAAPDRVIGVPEALHRFYLDPLETPAPQRRVGATWMTREDRERDIADNAEYLDRVAGELRARAPAARLAALGFSQGAATVSRWAVATELPVERLVLWGSGLPPDLDWDRGAPRLRSMRLTLVAGDRDRWVTADRLAEERARIERHGVACEVVRFDGRHALDADTLRRIGGETLAG